MVVEKKLVIGHFGMGGHSWQAEQYRDRITKIGHTLRTCHEYQNADVPYSKETIKQFIDSCDILIFPSREAQPAKSSNRLVLAWSRRKPCIVSRLDAFLRIAKHKENAMIVDDNNDFIDRIIELADNPELMQKIADNGYKEALLSDNGYSAINYSKKYLKEIRKQILPKIHVAIPHYLPRIDYLSLAVESVLDSVGVEVVVSIASSSPTHIHFEDPRVRVYQQRDNMSFSVATNKALSNMDSDTTHVLLLNDDTIVSKHSLRRMVSCSNSNDNSVVNPLSNCDMGWLHNYDLKLGELQLVPNMQIENISSEQIDIIRNTQFSDMSSLVSSDFAAFYATLIPIDVYNGVGKLNEGFKNGGEDADWCYRAKRLGYKVGWTPDSFIFHFGGKSRKQSHEVRGLDHELEDQFNNTSLRKRWPVNKKRIAIYTGPAWENWNIETPYTTGIGGSEYCAGQLAKELARQGHNVTMYGHHEEGEQYGVNMKHWTNFHPEEEYWDLFVASRSIASVPKVKAKTIVAWIHDIFCLDGKSLDYQALSKVDKFLCLTPWHKDFFSDYHGVPKSKIEIVPNGMDTTMLNFDPDNKVYGKMHYSSSPDRGLDNLLYMLPFIKEQIPEIHLDIYYGFFNWKSSVQSRGDRDQLRQLESMEKQLEMCKDFVNFKGRVNLPQLHNAWNKAYVWGFPTHFTETFCITAKEAQYSGTPIVCSDIAALKTTVGDFGMQIPFPYSYEGRKTFIDEVVKLHKDRAYWEERSRQSLSGANNMDWTTVVDKYWSNYL